VVGFVDTQEQKLPSMLPFFNPVYSQWFEKFLCCKPTKEDLADAMGDHAVVDATVKKAMKTVSSSFSQHHFSADM